MLRASIRRRAGQARPGGSSGMPRSPGSSLSTFCTWTPCFSGDCTSWCSSSTVPPDAPGRRHLQPDRRVDGAAGQQPRPQPRRAVRGNAILDPRPRIALYALVRRRIRGRRRDQNSAPRCPAAADERDLRTLRRHPAPRDAGPRAHPRQAYLCSDLAEYQAHYNNVRPQGIARASPPANVTLTARL